MAMVETFVRVVKNRGNSVNPCSACGTIIDTFDIRLGSEDDANECFVLCEICAWALSSQLIMKTI